MLKKLLLLFLLAGTALGQPADERFMNYLDASCRNAEDPKLRPAEAVIQNQLFSENPL